MIAAILLVTTGCTQAPDGDAEPRFFADSPGAQIYKKYCAACHDSGEGEAPKKEALNALSMETILGAMTTGIMQPQAANMSPGEIRIVADYLAAPSSQSALENANTNRCEGTLTLSKPLWNRWGNNKRNTRYQSAEHAGLSAKDVPNLKLKWAFGFPGAARARSQPSVTEEAIFTGSQSGLFYALDAKTGCVWWTFEAKAEVRHAPTIEVDASGNAKTLYFGDFDANVYAIDAASGKLIWTRAHKDHSAGTITGSPTLHDGRLYVPMSSLEVINAYLPDYECCTFRGGILALDAKNGDRLWRFYTVPEPQKTGKNDAGADRYGPSGAPVWSTPTIDEKRGLLYFGTGENYSSPANERSDAIIALDLKDGEVAWISQTIEGDAWNGACGRDAPTGNCPEEDGPDFDFGAPPILTKLPSGKDIILAGQKSGMIFGMAPDDGGKILWQQRAGMGGFNGGVHWGMATDGKTLFVGIADTPGNKFATGPEREGMHTFDIATGKPIWSKFEPKTCDEIAHKCMTALSAPPTLTDGVIFAGALNGLLRAYSQADGSILWTQDTRRDFDTVNGIAARGGSIDSSGPVVAGGLLIVNSGYDKFGQIPGNVMLVYGVD